MPNPFPTPPTNPEDDAAYYREVLHALVERATRLADRIDQNATAATPTPENRADADPTIAFDRIARTIRRTIALARHIAKHPAAEPTAQSRTTARAQLIRGVEDAIHRQRRTGHPKSGEDADAQSLYQELNERLEDPELELDLQGRPTHEIIEEICRDLGVAVQGRSYVWRRRTPEDIAALRARAAAQTTQQPTQATALHLVQGGKQGGKDGGKQGGKPTPPPKPS